MRLTLAAASLRRHRTRTLLAVLGVAVAAAMLLDMVMLAGGMRESFRQLLLSKGFQLRVAPKGTLPFDSEALIDSASALTERLRANPDVGTVSPVLGATVYVPRAAHGVGANRSGANRSGANKSGATDTGASGEGASSFALGVDPASQGDYELLNGRDATAPDAIVVNDDFLAATGTRVGDTVTIARAYDPQLRAYAGERRAVVAGRAKFLYMSAGQPVIALRLDALQAMGGAARTDRVSLFMVKARPTADVEAVRRWIERNAPRVTAISTQTALAQVDERLSYFRQLAFILGAVSLFVGFLLVATLMSVSVNERVGEIGVMRAIGVSKWHVVQQVVLEGVAISVTGAVLGLGLGLATARYLNGILSDFPGLPMAIEFFLFQPATAWQALGMLTASGILAGVYPAWRAGSMPIATTLRREAIA